MKTMKIEMENKIYNKTKPKREIKLTEKSELKKWYDRDLDHT